MRPFSEHRSWLNFTSFLVCALIAAITIVLFFAIRPASALPEYSVLTGESCGVCHVNPGGGGPRTLRGLLWAARGKPAQLPPLPPVLIAPEVQDAYELYRIACGSCHGVKGEGSAAMGLVGTSISATATRSYLLNGIPKLGMPAFKDQLTDAQLESLISFVTGLGDGTVALPPLSFPVAPAQLHGKPAQYQKENEGN